MGRLGLGTDRNRSSGKGGGGGTAPSIPSLSPSTGWTGIAGSGFAVAPSDPVRTTAKPVCRLIVLPNEAYTASRLVGVYAGANDGGSLLNTMGLLKVSFHYEGSTVDVAAPTFQTITDANGVARTYFGWWARLAHDGRNGIANLYVEAVPRNTAMQNRVIGPYAFLPRASLYDHDLTVAPSQAAITGSRYQSIAAAINYLASQTFENARITLAEAGDYNPNGATGLNLGQNKGRVVIEAAVPVTIRAAAPTSSLYWFRPKCEPVCWRGANITLDFVNSASYLFESAYANHRNAFDGCTITTSAGRQAMFLKMPHAISPSLMVGNQWLTEVNVSALPNVTVGAQLVRGLTGSQTYADYNNLAMLGCTIDDHDSRWFTTPIDAMTVSYSGPGATATIEKSVSGFNRIFTARVDGVSVGTFTIAGTFVAGIADTQFSPRHVVAWINTLAGWSANLLDDTRAGWALYPGTGVNGGAFAALDVKTAPATLRIAFDIHGDIAQVYNAENVLLADNVVTDSDVQMVFFKDGYLRDALVVNNGFDNKNGNNFSQFADLHSHVVTAHNSWSRQGFSLRTDFTGGTPNAKYNPDPYCLFANNVCPTLSWGNTADADLAIADNHLMTGGGAPAGSTNTTIGGSWLDLFVDSANGNFAPANALLTNLARPVVAYDLARKQRRITGQGAAKGAVA